MGQNQRKAPCSYSLPVKNVSVLVNPVRGRFEFAPPLRHKAGRESGRDKGKKSQGRRAVIWSRIRQACQCERDTWVEKFIDFTGSEEFCAAMGDSHEDTSELYCPRERAPAPVPVGHYRDKRRGLVLWIASKANRFSLKTTTIHYATNYLDRCDQRMHTNIPMLLSRSEVNRVGRKRSFVPITHTS